MQSSISQMPRTPSDGELCALWGQTGDDPGPLSACSSPQFALARVSLMPALSKFGSTLK